MIDPNCGCGTSPTPTDEYLLVKATSKNPNQCGDPTSVTAANANCAKKEPMYDVTLNDFLIPSESGVVIMTVCNASIYSVGSWLEFLNPVTKLKITSINGNIITLVNKYDDGTIVTTNPAAGQVITKSTAFVVSTAPVGKTTAETLVELNAALETAQELCVPALLSCSTSAEIQPVGRVITDPSNLSVKKCLRRIYGIIFKAGRPVLTALGATVNPNDANFRKLVKHNTTNEVRIQKNYNEDSSLVANNRYALIITNSSERTKGPIYFTKIFDQFIEETKSESGIAPATAWPSFTTNLVKSFDLSSYTDIAAINADTDLDHYYVIVKLDVGVSGTSAYVPVFAELENGYGEVKRASVVTDTNSYVDFVSSTVTIKVKKSDNTIKLRLKYAGTVKYYYRIMLDGAYY